MFEIVVSRHHGGPNMSHPEIPFNCHITIVLWGLREDLNYAHIMPREASLSNSGCDSLHSGDTPTVFFIWNLYSAHAYDFPTSLCLQDIVKTTSGAQ